LISKIKNGIDKKLITLGIFIDLKKAFDTISHKKLIKKFANIGISGTALKILESYLKNRSQIVKIGQYKSNPHNITFGIPQGSILGSLFFIIYVNNLDNLGLSGHLTLYADDTCLFYSGYSIHDIIVEAQKDLDKLNSWFLHNLLTINVKKNIVHNF
jgi:retron-type reverse transcriptase